MSETYRVGRSLGRTIYRNDKFIGIMDTVDDAEMIVWLLNQNYASLILKARHAARERSTSGEENQG